MNNKRVLSILSITALGLSGLFSLIIQGNTININASNSKTVDILPLLKDALKNKNVDVTPSQYTLYSSSIDASYVFEVSNVYVDGSENLIIKRDGYIRNLTAFNGLSKLTFDFDGSVNEIDTIIGSYNSEKDMIVMSDKSTSSCSVSGDTNFSIRNKSSFYADKIITELKVTYNCINGHQDNVATESYKWSEEFDFYNVYEDGSEEYPYRIESCAAMRALARVNNSGVDLEGKYFQCNANLNFDIENINYVPVGTSTNKFNGNFDGNGMLIIVNERIVNVTNWGVFGSIGSKGVVKNTSVYGDLYMNNCTNVGGIAGESYGYLENVLAVMSFEGLSNDTIENSTHVGGLIGSMYDGTLYNSQSPVDISVDSLSNTVGGIAGYVEKGTMELVAYGGDLTAPNDANFIGGFIGVLYRNIQYESVITNYVPVDDSQLNYDFSFIDGGVTTQVNVGVGSNNYHGRYVGYSTYVPKN